MMLRVAGGNAAAAAKSAPVARALSTAAATTTDDSYNFVASRRAYRAEVKLLRKTFIDEVARRKEQQARDAEAQRLKIMKEKAARLEIKRQQQAIRAAEVAREKALHEEKVRQYFEEKVLVREARNAEVEKRRQALLDVLREQSKSWITSENLEDKLKEDVFMYSSEQVAARAAFDPSAATGSAMSWLEKLQRMKPAGLKEESEEAVVAEESEKEEE
ncbi:hypothetical protein Poli38472_010228 [Pythium oligandrum]|uniref:Uncharacterized protein n=1 Tax=Pythium oligandrum TaxID=41045 RepID=A0A8K1C8Z2_PYTOL|nr:hypothetical protein Poli38472_010228 [Pythium oligandrum]|eukprot:TMW58669.1 hypothetical protein Poli38472_010228 [Pythium oligandrum]